MNIDQAATLRSARKLLTELHNKQYSTQKIAQLGNLSATTLYRLQNRQTNHVTSKTFHRLLQVYCMSLSHTE